MGTVSSILDFTPLSLTASQQQKQQADKPFADFLSDASASTTSASGSSRTDTGSTGLEEFMAYAKETPAERMFDCWLKSQNVTMDEYKSMSPEEQQALQSKFEVYLKSKLDDKMGVGSSAQQSLAALTK